MDSLIRSGRAPVVMVSSTFYDLRQVRSNLSSFLANEMGYVPLLSELNSFPVDPDLDTIENCRRKVQDHADIMVLIIGGRYGFVDSVSDKSVTNLEYLVARNKSIPIYVFAQRQILTLVEVWRKNPSADFKQFVDDVRVFSFIDGIRTADRSWVYEFDDASEIINILRKRFAELLTEAVDWRRRTGVRSSLVKSVAGLHGLALRIALEQSELWEHRLLFQLVSDELDARRSIRRDHRLGIRTATMVPISAEIFPEWNQQRMGELTAIIDSVKILFDRLLGEAIGPPGVPGEVEKILDFSQGVGSAYERSIQWAQRVRSAVGDEVWRPVTDGMADFTSDIIEKLEEWVQRGMHETSRAIERKTAGDNSRVDVIWQFGLGGESEKVAEIVHEIYERVKKGEKL